MKECFLIAVSFLWSCTEPTENAKADVRAVVSGILDADNHADIDRVLSNYDDEAILLPPGKEEIKGLENIRRNYENIFATSLLNLAPEEEEIILTEEVAVYRGRTKGKVVLKSDSTERTINDKFVMILKSDNGRWKIKTLIWN
jgi:ketosteroid isomerase-like protein